MNFRVPALCVLLCGFASAQVPNPTSQPPADQNPNGYAQSTTTTSTGETVPLFKVQVVSRTIEAVNYRHLGGETKVGLIGTTLMPQAKGDAHVDSRHGRVVISAKFDKIGPASQYGPEYLTYVLWAITPEGRAQNLGELPLKDDHAQLDVTTDLQTFGMLVTAEPYFAVTQPSDVVVMENKVLPDTKGQIEEVSAKYELLPRGQYVKTETAKGVQPLVEDVEHDHHKVPLGLLEARNAVRLAQAAEADEYAADSLAKAQASLDRAEDYYHRKQWKPVETAAREAAQNAEDARVIALRRREQKSIADARERDRQRTEEARARASAAEAEQQREAEQRARAEQDLQAAQQARQQAELAQQQADQARQAALTAQQQAEQQRLAAEQQAQQSQQQAQQAQQQAQQAQLQAQQAEQQKEALRQRLQQQLNTILQTRDSARGLIVNMSDVLFDTNKYTLKPGAREKLAKVSGILLAYPGLKVQVEGYTDSTGSPEYNQRLSEQRAMTVRDYLTAQGINMNSVTAQGFGQNDPVASNGTASGRQQNRRVQMVVSGEPIGEVASAEGQPSTIPADQQVQQNQVAPTANQPYQQPQMQPSQQNQQPQMEQPQQSTTVPR
ncbi:MAG TPA: OmpA family protein [Terriglobales bacterium]|nr:OmpA family protein [Terriglobales bacterium]